MGFFNFFYHLKHFLRRMPKKILVTIIIILLLFIFSTQSHATTVTVTNESNVDAFQYLKTQYDINWYRLVNASIRYAQRNNNTFSSQIKDFFKCVIDGGSERIWYIDSQNAPNTMLDSSYNSLSNSINLIYFGYGSLENDGQRTEVFDFIAPSSYSSNSTQSRYVLAFQYNRPCTIYSLQNWNFVFNNVTTTGRMVIPSGLERYCPDDLWEIVRSIYLGTFDFDNTNTILNQIETNTNEANQEINDMNNFIQDDTVDDYSTEDLPQSNITDPTESTFNGIFNRLYSAVSNDSYHTVCIPLKFGQWDKSFSLNSNSLDFMKGDRNRDLVAFIELIWSFVIYYYILRDIYNMVNDLSQGKIAEKVDNIKTQLL